MMSRRARAREHGHFLYDWIRRLLIRLDESRALGLAAETAFFLFLALIPLAAVTGMLAARFSLDNWRDIAPLVSSLPSAGRRLVRSEMQELATWNGGSVSAISAFVFMVLASSGMHAIFDALDIQVGVQRAWWRKRLLSLGACLVLPIVVVLLAMLGPGVNGLLHKLDMDGLDGTFFASFAGRLATSTILIFAYVYAIYFVGIPRRTRHTMPIVPGTLTAVGVQLVSGYGYGFYIREAGDGSAYVAGLAAIGITMMGLYLFSLSLLVGAMVNRMLGDTKRARIMAQAAAHDGSPDTPPAAPRSRSHAERDHAPR